MSWDYIMKFVIAGEAGTGKTSILYRLTDSKFLTTPDPTIGVEFGSKLLRVSPSSSEEDEGKWIKLQCWDVAGSPSFRSITKSYYRGAAGALLVFDVTRKETFLQLPLWLKDLRAHADPSVSIILLGNKSDLDPPISTDPSGEEEPIKKGKREVEKAEGEAFAKQEGLLFLECSAKSGEGVNEAFDQTAREILEKINQGLFEGSHPSSKSKSSGIKLSSSIRGDRTNSIGTKGACC